VCFLSFLFVLRPPPTSTLFPYTTLFRSRPRAPSPRADQADRVRERLVVVARALHDEAAALEPFERDAARHDAVDHRVRRLGGPRSEEHTSELQSQSNLVCRLLLEKKKKN